jgi:hypothetical protein
MANKNAPKREVKKPAKKKTKAAPVNVNRIVSGSTEKS